MDAIRRAGMLVIGLAGDAADMEAVSNGLSLPVLSGFRAPHQPVADVPPAQPAAAPAEPVASVLATLIQDQTVRSGQRIYARNRDLIVTAGIGAGAEVMADRCLHIYGSLRRRAMAGARRALPPRLVIQALHSALGFVAARLLAFRRLP